VAEGSSDRIRIRQYCPIGRQRPAVHVAMLGGGDRPRRRWPQDAEFLDLFGAVSVLPGPASSTHSRAKVSARP